MPVVEAAAAEAGQTAAEQAEPHVAGLLVDVDRGDDLPGQAVLLPPALDLAGPLVEQARPSSVPTQTRGPSAFTAKMWSFGSPSATVNCFHFV